MSVYKPTYKPTERLDITLLEDVTPFRFVNHLGSICSAGAMAAGVTEFNNNAGDHIAVIKAGTAILKIKEAVASAGIRIASNATGYGVLADTAKDYVNAISLQSGEIDDEIEVEVVKFQDAGS